MTLVDHREHLGQQRFTAAPQIGHHVAGQTRELDQQQRQVRQGRLPIALLPRASAPFRSTESRCPTSVAGPRDLQPQHPARVSVQEREEQRVRPPSRPRRSRVLAERGGVEEHRDPVFQLLQLPRVEHLTRGRHVYQARRGDIPERREIVDVTTTFAEILGPGRSPIPEAARIGPVLVDRHPARCLNHPSWPCHFESLKIVLLLTRIAQFMPRHNEAV